MYKLFQLMMIFMQIV